MATLTPSPKMAFFDNNGNPLSGGKVYTYLSGTLTPAFTKTDSTGAVNNTNPVILDARGEASIWLDPTIVYRFVLKTSTDVELWTSDGISGFLTPATKGQQRFTANGSFTVPAGVTTIWISGVAGGGQGGGGGSNAVSGSIPGAGGGGGGGQAAYKKAQTVTPGEVIPITIGLGGTATAGSGDGGTPGSDNAANGAGGTDTIVGTYLTLTHGSGGLAGRPGSLTLTAATTDGAGGSGGQGIVYGAQIDGQTGGWGNTVGPSGGSPIQAFSGYGGSSLFGFGGQGQRITYSAPAFGGYSGRGYGAGGSGGGVCTVNPSNGGPGASGTGGMVLIEW